MSESSIGRYIGESILFSTYLENDIRTPFASLSIPATATSFLGENYKNVKLGLVMTSIEFWIAILVVLFIGSLFNIIMAVLSYNFIVLPKKRQHELQHKKYDKGSHRGTITPYIFGFGVIMPLAIMYPYQCIRYFGVKNTLMKFFFGVQSITTFFRCSEGRHEECNLGLFIKLFRSDLITTMFTYYSHVWISTKIRGQFIVQYDHIQHVSGGG